MTTLEQLHKKAFINTWMYDKTILKRYVVRFRMIYLLGGGVFNQNLYNIDAYTEKEAIKKAKNKLYKRPEDKILKIEAIAVNNLSK